MCVCVGLSALRAVVWRHHHRFVDIDLGGLAEVVMMMMIPPPLPPFSVAWRLVGDLEWMDIKSD